MPSHGAAKETPAEPAREVEPSPVGSPSKSDYDEWEMEERLRHLDRIYARSSAGGPLSGPPRWFRIDSMHGSIPWQRPLAKSPAAPGPSGLARFGRVILMFGLAITVCGASLAVWGKFGARPDLLPLGIPIAAAGQVLLLVGLVLQSDSQSNTPRAASRTTGGDQRLITGNGNLRIDDADGTSRLDNLAARLEELSRRFEERDG